MCLKTSDKRPSLKLVANNFYTFLDTQVNKDEHSEDEICNKIKDEFSKYLWYDKFIAMSLFFELIKEPMISFSDDLLSTVFA